MYDDASSIGQASAAVAMANDAIDNARRAAASSRSKRSAAAAEQSKYMPPSPARSTPGGGGGSGRKNNNSDPDPDLKHNDSAYHVIATLLTERLLPKIEEAGPGSTHYTLTSEDVAFFQKMLPYGVRRSFVDALRYRLQLMKCGVGNKHSALGKLTMSCQMLGLDRESMNVLLDLNSSAGTRVSSFCCVHSYELHAKFGYGTIIGTSRLKSMYSHHSSSTYSTQYPINYKDQGPVAVPSPTYGANNNGSSSRNGDNGVNFGLNSPMNFSPTGTFSNTFSPTNNNNNSDNFSTPVGGGIDETSAESLARQQIMAEINETKFLMRGSVTPDAVNFWKKHLEELSQRLVALSLEEQLKAAGSGGSVGGGAGGGGGPASPYQTPVFSNEYEMDMYDKVKKHYDVPSNNMLSRDEYRDAEFGGGSGGVGPTYSPDGHNMMGGSAPNNASSMPPPPPRQQQQYQSDELPVCDVVAPSDLPGGYMFEAQLGSKKFLATVPPGGVTKGQRFVSTMQELETIEIPVPLGAWRDGVSECFNDGMCHPLFLNTLFFPCSE